MSPFLSGPSGSSGSVSLRTQAATFAAAVGVVAFLVGGSVAAVLTFASSETAGAVPGITGDVEVDFDPSIDPAVIVIADPGGVGDAGVPADLAGTTSGWDMRDVRLYYDRSADELFVGLNFDGVGGDADGDGDPGSGAISSSASGTDVASFGGTEGFAVLFDIDSDGVADVIAGVNETGDISSFGVYEASPFAIFAPAQSLVYGAPIPGALGLAPSDTSTTSPDLEFSIVNFSTLVPDDTSPNFGLHAFAGSGSDGGIGEEYVANQGAFEPVVIFDPAPGLTLEKSTNGVDADLETEAPTLLVGSTATFSYLATNTGNVALVGVEIVDDVIGAVCRIETLPVGGEDSCEASAVVSLGGYRNLGTATGQGVDAAGNPVGEPVVAEDPSHHVGGEPGIGIEKSTNGLDADAAADAPVLPVGSTATFRYVVENTGTLDLVDVAVSDDLLGDVCTIELLPVGASDSCEASETVREGDYRNVGLVVGQGVDTAGNPLGEPVAADDPSHHVGGAGAIDIEKAVFGINVDEAPGPSLPVGVRVDFTFEVTNTGALPLGSIAVVDDVLGPILCPSSFLDVGERMVCTYPEYEVLAGDHQNLSSVTGQPLDADGNTVGLPVSDADPNFHNGFVNSIDIEKATNLVDADEGPGPELDVGSTATFTYVVTNTSPLDMVDVRVTDNVLGVICTIDFLPAATSPANMDSCTAQAPVGYGEYVNVGAVDAQPVTTSAGVQLLAGPRVTDADPSHHVGVCPQGTEAATGDDGVTSCVDEPVLPPVPPVPPVAMPCTNLIEGPSMWAGAQTVWHTGLTAVEGSTILVVTSENGSSPSQPNEQVYVVIGDSTYGPTPAGLGELEIDVLATGPVTVLHYSEVTGDVSSPNSVVPAVCGEDLTPTPVLCADVAEGPGLWWGGQTVWDTGLTALAGSPIRLVTSENGSSPSQPNEQVYVRVGEDLYGPSPVGLGELVFVPTNGGSVTVLHYSVVAGDTSSANSVVPSLCGAGLEATPVVCAEFVEGPVLYVGGETVWHTNYFAKAGSQIRLQATEPGSSPNQPNEKIFLRVNGEIIGMTPSAPGEATFEVESAGPVSIVHYSEVTGDVSSANSVVPKVCGSDWLKIDGGLRCELPDGTPVEIALSEATVSGRAAGE